MSKNSSKQKHLSIELSPSSIFLWGLFLLFLLFWVFVLGIFVGKGLLSGVMSEINSPIKKLQEIVGKMGDKDESDPEKKEDPELVFYELLENRKNKVKNRVLPPKVEKSPANEVTLARDETIEKQDASEIMKSAEPADLQEETPGELFSVQIASISDIKKVEKLIKELVNQGNDAYYYTATINGKLTYRVMCGRFNSRVDALEHLNKLQKEKGYKGFVSKVEK